MNFPLFFKKYKIALCLLVIISLPLMIFSIPKAKSTSGEPRNVKEIESLAHAGDHYLQGVLAVYYYHGHEGVEQSYQTSSGYARNSMEGNCPLGHYVFGLLYKHGHIVSKDHEKANEYFSKAAPLMQKLVEKGEALAQSCLAAMYENGDGVEKNLEKASKLYKAAAEQSDPYGLYAVAQQHLSSTDKKKNEKLSFRYLSKAAKAGHPKAQLELGIIFQEGKEVKRNNKKALQWFEKAAGGGDTHAQFWVGRYYEIGTETEQNLEKAIDLYGKAVRGGDKHAQFYLGVLYANGEGVEKNAKSAFNLFYDSAHQGVPEAQYNLAEYYYRGIGVRRNSAKAFYWYKKSSDQGHAWAQSALGLMYLRGDTVSQDYQLAEQLLKKAADAGDSDGQNGLGILYLKRGKRDQAHYKTAYDWFLKAAKQDNDSAQYNLGRIYEEGDGVKASLGKAKKWYKKAAQNGNENAITVLKNFDEKKGYWGKFNKVFRKRKKDFKDPITGMEFVHIPESCFQMGDTFNEGESDEKPVHEVCIKEFYIGKHEVTIEQYRKYMIASKNENCINWGAEDTPIMKTKGYPLRENKFGRDNRQPIIEVSWNNAVDMAKWLSRESGRQYRLPTEAEWEYAAREGGKNRRFGTGEDIIGTEEANLNARKGYKKPYSRDGIDRGQTTIVATFPPNRLGLYDMTGNVWEWCSDFYGKNFYATSPKDNPVGPPSGPGHVIRGGSWGSFPGEVRASYRSFFKLDKTGSHVGFRLVLNSK